MDDRTTTTSTTCTSSVVHTARRRPEEQNHEHEPQLARCLDASSCSSSGVALDRYLLEQCIATILPLLHVLPQQQQQQHRHKEWILPLLDMIVLYWTRGQTPAVRALGLRLETTTTVSRSSSLHLYAFLRCGVPLLVHLLETVILREQDDPLSLSPQPSITSTSCTTTDGPTQRRRHETTTTTVVRSIRAARRRLWLRKVLLQFPRQRILPVVRWVLHVLCWSGYLASPDWAMVVSGCRYSSNSNSSGAFPTTAAAPTLQPQMAFAHRRWMWELLWRTVLLLGTTSWSHLRIPKGLFVWRTRTDTGTTRAEDHPPHNNTTKRLVLKVCPVCQQTPLQPVVLCSTCQQEQPYYCYVCSVLQHRKRQCSCAAAAAE